MRSVLAGTIGLSLGLGGLMAQGPTPAVSLGRPVPAASLGRPSPLSTSGGGQPFQPASYRSEASFIPALAPADSAPRLSPVAAGPGDEALGAPRPLPTDGAPGSVATPPPGSAAGPVYGPSFGPLPGGDCAAGNCAPGGYTFLGAPGPAFGGYGFNESCNRFYSSVDFLLLFGPDIDTPLPLAMVSPNPFTPADPFPADSTVAIGNTNLINHLRLGARANAGLWLDPCHRHGLDFGFMFVGPTSRDLVAVADGSNSLFRPYVVINLPEPGNPAAPPGRPNFADVVANIGDTGFVRVHTDSFLIGADANYRRRVLESCGNYLDVLTGFRYMHLNETLLITESGTPGGAGAAFTLSDRFRTTNNFYGWQIGAVAHKQWGPWSADLLLKLAVGPTGSTVDISGANNFAANPNVGLFANDSNIGNYYSSNVSVIPEVGLNLGYQLTPRMRVHVGYTGLYWSNVLQPGNQIDPIIDQTKVPIPPGAPVPGFQPLHPSDPHPVIPFRRSDYWLQGINFGLSIRW